MGLAPEHAVHPFAPVWDVHCRVLVLGSFPSVRSRQIGFYYGHPQNRFWKVTSAVIGCPVPQTIEEKKEFLLSNNIALWDVIASCDIEGSSDNSIKNVSANDLAPIISQSHIEKIFVNGQTAKKYYDKYTKPVINIDAVALPSTSPANAAWSLERLIEAWSAIKIL